MKSPLQLIKAMESASSGKSEEAAQIDKINREKAKRLGLDSEVVETPKASIPGSVKVVASSSATDAESDADTSSDSASSSDDEPAPAQETESVSAAQVLELANALKAQMESQEAAHKAELERIKAEHEAEVARAKAEAEATRQELEEKSSLANVMTDLNKLLGKTGGNAEKKPLTVVGEGSAELRGFERLVESAPKSIVNSPQLGRVIQRDTRVSDAYFKKNREAIRGGVEAIMKEAGLLTGNMGSITTESLTIGQIPSASFNYLSAMIRTNPLPDFIHALFCTLHATPGVAPRQVANLPRYPYNALPTAVSQRILTPGTALSTATRNTTEDLVSVTMQEVGLGKDNDNAPLGVSEFVEAMSLVSLEGIVERNLGTDYHSFIDLWTYSEWFNANTVFYNNGGIPTNTAADISTGDDGTLTRAFLLRLHAWMRTDLIPTYRDGCYALVLNPTAAAQLLSQLNDQERYMSSQTALDSVLGMLAKATQNEGLGGEVTGYLGRIDSFHCFVQNRYGVMTSGDPGTADVAFDASVGTKTALTSFALGADTTVRCIGMPMEIRADSSGTFGRLNRLIWISHEKIQGVELNNVANVSERRMVQIRTLGEAV